MTPSSQNPKLHQNDHHISLLNPTWAKVDDFSAGERLSRLACVPHLNYSQWEGIWSVLCQQCHLPSQPISKYIPFVSIKIRPVPHCQSWSHANLKYSLWSITVEFGHPPNRKDSKIIFSCEYFLCQTPYLIASLNGWVRNPTCKFSTRRRPTRRGAKWLVGRTVAKIRRTNTIRPT